MNTEAIQDGIGYIGWLKSTGVWYSHQFTTRGLIYDVLDLLLADEKGRQIPLGYIGNRLVRILRAAKSFYGHSGYQGVLRGAIKVTGVKGDTVLPVSTQGSILDTRTQALLNEYEWLLELDTSILSDPKLLGDFFVEKMKEIYWSFGYNDWSFNEGRVRKLAEDQNLIPKSTNSGQAAT